MAGSAHTDVPQGRTIDLDFVVVGGGILGTAVAALASQADYRVLVLRLNDSGIPRADTLRNQGWLQSGLLYRLEDFSDEAQYRNVAETTYFGGREMLRDCRMGYPPERGILRVVKTNSTLSDQNTCVRSCG
jgi:glycine/D-amino acid oxidase-like deaminating enzyme